MQECQTCVQCLPASVQVWIIAFAINWEKRKSRVHNVRRHDESLCAKRQPGICNELSAQEG